MDIYGILRRGGDYMTRKQAIDFLTKKPYRFGIMLGFDKLSEVHNKWIIDMVKGKDDKTLQASRG